MLYIPGTWRIGGSILEGSMAQSLNVEDILGETLPYRRRG
jgi:hypothetical protein